MQNAKKNLSISIGARVAIAVGIRHFTRGLSGSLIACATCHKAITRAEPLISELDKVVVQHPALDGAAAPLSRHIENPRSLIQTLKHSFTACPSQVEAQLRLIRPSSG